MRKTLWLIFPGWVKAPPLCSCSSLCTQAEVLFTVNVFPFTCLSLPLDLHPYRLKTLFFFCHWYPIGPKIDTFLFFFLLELITTTVIASILLGLIWIQLCAKHFACIHSFNSEQLPYDIIFLYTEKLLFHACIFKQHTEHFSCYAALIKKWMDGQKEVQINRST